MLRWFIFPVLALTSCNLVQPEIRIGAGQGIPAISGTAEVELTAFACGDVLPAGAYSVSSRVVPGGCELSFDKDIEIVGASDYQRIPELSSATTLLQSIEVKITQLAFIDADTNAALDPATRIHAASFLVNGQLVGDKATLSALPKTVTLNGMALSPLKAKIDQRQPATVKATSVVVLPDSPAPPKKLRIEYDAQPTLVLGAGDLKL